MAEQKGILPYTGKLGDTVGYKRNNKHFERAKPASYQPGEESQKSGAEFGAGSRACTIIKRAIAPLVLRSFKPDLHNRLATQLRKIIRTGPSAKKGERNVFDGNLMLLKGFELNPKVNFANLCTADLSSEITAKAIKLKISAFDWKSKIKAPPTADRLKIGLTCVFADFNTGIVNTINANQLSVDKSKSFPGGSFKIEVPAQEELAVLIVLNVFFETVHLKQSMVIENRNFQAGVILDVAHIKNGTLVEFIAEVSPKSAEKPEIQPDAFWELDED